MANILEELVTYSDGLMVTRKLRKSDKSFLKRLGKQIEHKILNENGYSSLDAFSIEFHDLITKPTLYQICKGERDMKISTLRGIAKALDIPITKLLDFES